MALKSVLKSSSLLATGLGLPRLVSAAVRGANDEIRVGVMGLGGRGTGAHIPRMGQQAGVRIAAICDPDRQRLASVGNMVERAFHHKPEPFVDVRKMLDRRDLDVVCIATMQYWHALGTIWACQAGKHVYCEKPLAHFIWEGRQMVNAARKYGRLVETGLQSRSTESVRAAMAYLKQGQLGKIRSITCFANKGRTPIGKRTQPLPIPATLDYELWCGPARKEPVFRDHLQYDCSFLWNTGDGESCNQGVHEIDVARWILGETGLPRRVMSIGGRFTFDDAGDVPNTQIIYYDFPTAPVLYEVHNLRAAKGSKKMPSFRGYGVDVCVDCEGGYVMVRAGTVYDKQGKKIKQFSCREDHFENFIRAVRSGRQADLHADVLEGHISTAICHAGNISYRLGRKASAAELRSAAAAAPPFGDLLERLLDHLRRHDVDPDASSITLGPWLECDRRNECLRDNPAANRLVRGFYRRPFVVPEVSVV
jgi:predicted dehydrogenase